jgi:putative FmdB family regulatory protein
MPTYDYRCDDCAHTFEAFHAMGAPKPSCETCGGATSRVLIRAPAIHGVMARGRAVAAGSLPECGKGCRCCP